MNNKIENVKQPVLPNDNSFNDEDILQDVLASLKHLSLLYSNCKGEASNKQLESKIDSICKEVGQMARDSFNLLFEKGWYSLEKEAPQKISQEINKFSSKKAALN